MQFKPLRDPVLMRAASHDELGQLVTKTLGCVAVTSRWTRTMFAHALDPPCARQACLAD